MVSDSNICNCTAINQYFDTITYNTSLVQNITLQSHNYLHISFDAVFINIKLVTSNITQYGQVDINGQINTFSAMVGDEYNCMPKTNVFQVDGKTNFSKVLPHSGNLNLTFSKNNLDIHARLGISNIVVDAILCGNNAEINNSTLSCICKQGFTETITSHGNPGHVYYEKQCL
ncbi:hypothetical protein ABPG74_002734 [Tetrahymena malaccensis]